MIAEQVSTTQEVANRLSELFREGRFEDAQKELFADDAQSIEPEDSQGLKSVKGLDAIRKKGEEWNKMVEETHGGYASEPLVAGKFIAIAMGVDVTMKQAGRVKMDEIAVYEVKDGKIVKEQFFY